MLVPGYTDFEEDIMALGEHFRSYEMIKRIEILPYHTHGAHKYESLGMKYQLEGVKPNTQEQLDRAKELFSRYFPVVYVN